MNNPLSFSSLKLDLFAKDGTRLRAASGFVLEADSRYYLITNRQVFSGREITGPEPYALKTSIHMHWGEGEKSFPYSMGTRRRVTIPLYGQNHTPTWIEYTPQKPHGPTTDIAVLPIRPDDTQRLFETLRLFSGPTSERISNANDWSRVSGIPISAIDRDVDYGPSDTVHIVGYPLGWAPEGKERSSSAFWRTSFIASEIYEAGMTRSDTFFIDPCAPEGMTGSPVIGVKNDRMKLLGVYSDRSTAEFGANAGLVWGAWLIKEIIGKADF